MSSPSSPPKWTREPLKAHLAHPYANTDDFKLCVAAFDCTGKLSLETKLANRDRAITCWNALLPIESPEDFVREVRETLEGMLQQLVIHRMQDAGSWGFTGSYSELLDRTGIEPHYMLMARRLSAQLGKANK